MPLRVNSARVAGGLAPEPEHSTFPEPQSPVKQTKEPELRSCEHKVRAQRRPDHDSGIATVLDFPLERRKPVVGSGAELAPESKPGHIVFRQRFVILNEIGSTSERDETKARIINKRIRFIIAVTGGFDRILKLNA